jgi:hypothetical protein
MKRRQFLHGAGALGAVTLLPVAAAAAAPASPARFALLRSTTSEAGARFVPHASCAASACDSAALRVRIDGLQAADGGPVLHELWLSAMFAAPDGGTSPFVAWQFAQGPRPHMGQRLSFVAPREGLRGFALDYRLQAASACEREACSLTSFALPLLTPGHYALLGPRRNGSPAVTRGLRHSGDSAAPLLSATARDFDCLAFRIERLDA